MDRQHVEAVEGLLTDLPCHWIEAPTATPPYRLLSQTGGRPFEELPLCGPNRAFTAHLSLTSVGATPEAAREKAKKARDGLGVEGEPVELTVPGRFVEIEWISFSASYVDRDLPLPVTNYPTVYVDLYRLTSVPT